MKFALNSLLIEGGAGCGKADVKYWRPALPAAGDVYWAAARATDVKTTKTFENMVLSLRFNLEKMLKQLLRF